MPDNSDVIIYAPYQKDDLHENEINWIHSFQSILEMGLKQITKKQIKCSKIFLDENLKEQKATLLISIILNPNVKNDELFAEKSKFRKHILVYADPDSGLQRQEDTMAVNLFDEAKNKKVNIFDVVDLKDEVWLKFLDIAYEVRNTISELEDIQGKEKEGNIFVAETSIEQNTNRETIIRELEHLGYKIFPEKHFPKNMVAFSDLVQQSLQHCFLSVHIIGNYYAPLLENIEVSTIELQNDLFHEVASERNKKGHVLKRLVWIPPDIKPKSEKQRLYIESFKRNIELLENTEIVQTPIEVFKTIIQEKAREMLYPNKVEYVNPEQSKTVYLISNHSNKDRLADIRECLIKEKFKLLEVESSTDKIELIQNHYHHLVNCDALLIDYSVENNQWLNSKLSDIVKSPGFGRKNDFLAKSVLINTKETPEITIQVQNLDLINNQKQDINRRLSSFIDKINKK